MYACEREREWLHETSGAEVLHAGDMCTQQTALEKLFENVIEAKTNQKINTELLNSVRVIISTAFLFSLFLFLMSICAYVYAFECLKCQVLRVYDVLQAKRCILHASSTTTTTIELKSRNKKTTQRNHLQHDNSCISFWNT